MTIAVVASMATLVVVLVILYVEARLSTRNEQILRAQGAVEASHDVYGIMRVAYPLSFVAIAIEGALSGPVSYERRLVGVALFVLAKALKTWAIAALGSRWTFRVLVPPGQPLVANGPYRFMRHPNYIAVCGELVGMAFMVGAPVTGVVALMGFGGLIIARVRVEERMLGLR